MAGPQTVQPTRRAAALCVAGFLAGCGASAPRTAPTQGMPVSWQNLLPACPVTRPWPWAEYVARNETEWDALWKAAHSMDPGDKGVPRDGRPVVDFERHRVVGITRGLGSDNCCSLYFGDMIEWPHEIEVRFVHSNPDDSPSPSTQPQSEGAYMPSITFLAKWALLPRSVKPVRFVRLRGYVGYAWQKIPGDPMPACGRADPCAGARRCPLILAKESWRYRTSWTLSEHTLLWTRSKMPCSMASPGVAPGPA